MSFRYIEIKWYFCTNFLEKWCENKSSGGGWQTQEGTRENYVTEFAGEIRKKKGTPSLGLGGLILCLKQCWACDIKTCFRKCQVSDMLALVVFPLCSLIQGSDPFSLEWSPLTDHTSPSWTTDDHYRDISVQQISGNKAPLNRVTQVMVGVGGS